MQNIKTSVTLLLLLALSACAPGGGNYDDANPATFTVVKVFDGDSLIVRDATGKQTELRLFGIDAPERGQPYSNKAKQELTMLLRQVKLRIETVEIDRYDRTVATVYRQDDSESVNTQMVREGYAWVYRQYNNDPAMLALEDQARKKRIGLWAAKDKPPVAPWEWRRKARQR